MLRTDRRARLTVFVAVVAAVCGVPGLQPGLAAAQKPPNRQGRFSIAGLPPAIYDLAVSRGVEEGGLGDPRTLDRLSGGATVVELAEGERTIQDLRVSRPSTRAAARLTAHR